MKLAYIQICTSYTCKFFRVYACDITIQIFVLDQYYISITCTCTCLAFLSMYNLYKLFIMNIEDDELTSPGFSFVASSQNLIGH